MVTVATRCPGWCSPPIHQTPHASAIYVYILMQDIAIEDPNDITTTTMMGKLCAALYADTPFTAFLLCIISTWTTSIFKNGFCEKHTHIHTTCLYSITATFMQRRWIQFCLGRGCRTILASCTNIYAFNDFGLIDCATTHTHSAQ